MTIIIVDVGEDFYHRLANRDHNQGDGKNTAIEFRERYLRDLDNKESWDSSEIYITFDFKNVKKIGPSFANEAFAYFTKYSKPKRILDRIRFENISEVQSMIIEEELDAGYKKR